jgi:hypothetical protein
MGLGVESKQEIPIPLAWTECIADNLQAGFSLSSSLSGRVPNEIGDPVSASYRDRHFLFPVAGDAGKLQGDAPYPVAEEKRASG